MKRIKFVVFICIFMLIAGVILSSCGEGDEEQTSEPVILKFATGMPAQGARGLGWQDVWIKMFEEETNGRYKIDIYWSDTLYAGADAVEMLDAGVADISDFRPAYWPDIFAESVALWLPSTSYPATLEGAMADREDAMYLIQKYPSLAAEWDNYHIIGWEGGTTTYIVGTGSPVVVPDDLKGLKVCTRDALAIAVIEECGAVPVTLPPTEYYDAFTKGVIDINITLEAAALVHKFAEVADYHLLYPAFPASEVPIVMKKDKWNALPADIQDIITKIAPESQAAATRYNLTTIDKWRQTALDAGMELIEPTTEQKALWDELLSMGDDMWLTEMKSLGIAEAPDMLKEAQQLAAKVWGR